MSDTNIDNESMYPEITTELVIYWIVAIALISINIFMLIKLIKIFKR